MAKRSNTVFPKTVFLQPQVNNFMNSLHLPSNPTFQWSFQRDLPNAAGVYRSPKNASSSSLLEKGTSFRRNRKVKFLLVPTLFVHLSDRENVPYFHSIKSPLLALNWPGSPRSPKTKREAQRLKKCHRFVANNERSFRCRATFGAPPQRKNEKETRQGTERKRFLPAASKGQLEKIGSHQTATLGRSGSGVRFADSTSGRFFWTVVKWKFEILLLQSVWFQ